MAFDFSKVTGEAFGDINDVSSISYSITEERQTLFDKIRWSDGALARRRVCGIDPRVPARGGFAQHGS